MLVPKYDIPPPFFEIFENGKYNIYIEFVYITASCITICRHRRGAHTKEEEEKESASTKRKRDGELHAFFFSKEHLVDVNISYTERPTEAERAEMENSSASQWLQGPQLISLSSETLVPLTTVNPQQIFLRSMNNKVPLKMVKKYVFMCSKREKYLYTCVKHVHQVKVISHCKIIV